MTTALAPAETIDQPLVNPVNALLAAEFSDDSLWHEDREIFAGVYSVYSGIRYPQIGGFPDTSRYIADGEVRPWLAAAYGARIVTDPEHSEDKGVKIEACSLEAMVRIHERLSETVLVGEHAHTSTLVDPPEPEKGTESTANNTLWLEKIRDGYWPVVATFSHDYTDYHTANMELMPREVQDLMSTGAGYEIVWRAGFLKGKNPRIRGNNGQEDPFASGFRGDVGHTDGINKLDNISDTHSYLPLLSYMMEGESGDDQLAALNAYIKAEDSGGEHDERLHELAVDVIRLQRVVGDLLNFNTLHSTGRTTTEAAVNKAMKAVLHGTARIADKLQGRPAADADSVAPLSPEPITPEPAAITTAETVTDDWEDPYNTHQPETTLAAVQKTHFLGSIAARASRIIRREG